MLRPIWRRIWTRIEIRLAPIRQQLDALEARLQSVDARSAEADAAWKQHAPAFLNAVSSVGAFGHKLAGKSAELDEARANLDAMRWKLDEALATLDAMRWKLEEARTNADAARGKTQEIDAKLTSEAGRIWERLDFVRREILFEMKYAPPPSGAAGNEAPAVEPRIIATEKVAASQVSEAGLRLNLGCGHIALEGYVNVDQRDLPGVDVVAEVGNIPFQPGTVREISSAHLLEHFPQEALRRSLLPYWRSLLEPGGRFRAVVPDGEAMMAGGATGEYSFDDFREVLFGAQDYEGDFHFNMFTPKSLAGLLEEAGFRDISVPVQGRRNGKCFEFEIHAQR